MERDPAGEPLAHLAAQQIEVDLLVGADHALERDRDDVAGGSTRYTRALW